MPLPSCRPALEDAKGKGRVTDNPKKLVISWFSNAPWVPTGYGNQTKLSVPRLKALGHEISITSFYGLEGAPIEWDGIHVFPRAMHPYGQDIIGATAASVGADILITLLDAFVIEADNIPPTIGWYPWFPVDHEPMPVDVMASVRRSRKAIVYSKFAKREAEACDMDVYYVPHGVDTAVFRPADRLEARKAIGAPPDAFMVGMVAANKGNPPRKAFFEQIAAFAALHKKHPDTILYLHTQDGTRPHPERVDLVAYSRVVGLVPGKDVFFPDQYMLTLGYNDAYMRMAYSAMDVLTNVSCGEGFGIPIVEAQACGTPVIVGDWTSMPELCFSGWMVGKDEAERVFTNFRSFQFQPHAGAIAECMFAAYEMRGNDDYRKAARHGALQYDADKVMEKYWRPTLEDIWQRVQDERETQTSNHNHVWSQIGISGNDGISLPCTVPGCKTEQIISRTGNRIVPNGYNLSPGGMIINIEDIPGSAISKIVMREIERDYQIDKVKIPPDSVIVDIGAHVGVVSVYLAKRFPDHDIYAFEPIPELFALLLRNLEANNVKNVVAVNAAVTCDGRDVSLFGNLDVNSGGSSIIYNGAPKRCVAKSIRLQDQLDGRRIGLLKIDCEGAEYEILTDELLSRVDVIRGEFHRTPSNNPLEFLAHVIEIVKDTKVTILT